MLMGLGSLATIAARRPAISLFLCSTMNSMARPVISRRTPLRAQTSPA
jgi:hypothetical protein